MLFTLFNCLTVPVYAVSLPILPAFIKTAQLAFNKSAAFETCQWPRRRVRPAPFRRHSMDPGTEARSVNTWGCICTEGTLMRAHTSARLPCTLVSSHSPPAARWFQPKHFQVGGLIEPLKPVINKPVGGNLGTDPGSLLKEA